MVKDCPTGKILNPLTGRCVAKTGKIGKALLKSFPKKLESPKPKRKLETPKPKKDYMSFEKYPFVITDVQFDKSKFMFDKYHRQFIIKTNGIKDFKFIAIASNQSKSVFRKWKDDFKKLIGNVIVSISVAKFPPKFRAVKYYPEGKEYVVEGIEYNYITQKLYEAKLSNGETFKFLLVNYSFEEEGIDEGFINVKVIAK